MADKKDEPEGRAPYLKGPDGMIYPYDKDLVSLPGMVPWHEAPGKSQPQGERGRTPSPDDERVVRQPVHEQPHKR